MKPRPPRSTRTDTLFPYTTLFRSALDAVQEKAAAIIQGKSGGETRPRNRNRGQLPAHLPRVEQIVEPESRMCPCGCGEMARIGEDVSERLDVIPAQFRVLVTRRPKYRSEEHTSELQSLLRNSYADFCLKKNKN